MGANNLPSVVIVGTGNLAFSLGKSLTNASYPLKAIWGRNTDKSAFLATDLQTKSVKNINDLPYADVVFLCVSDDSIAEVSQRIPKHFKLMLHTSGSKPINELLTKTSKAVFYPYQTFSNNRITSLKNIPVFIETENNKDQELLNQMAKNLGANSQILNSKNRQVIHLAGVLSNNFSTLFIGKSRELLLANGLSPHLLEALMQETVSKALENSLSNALTGPAKRNDEKTIENQINMIKSDKELAALYKLISSYITKNYSV